MKREKAKGKTKCPYCGRKYANLKLHLNSCKKNPENQAPDAATAKTVSPETITREVEHAVEHSPVIQALQDQLAGTREFMHGLKGKVDQLHAEMQEVLKSVPESLENSVQGISETIARVVARLPDEGASPRARVITGVQAPRKRLLYPLAYEGGQPRLPGTPAALIARFLLKKRQAIQGEFEALVAAGNPVSIHEFLVATSEEDKYEHLRRRVNWRRVLPYAASLSPTWFTSCHVFAAFTAILDDSLMVALARLVGESRAGTVPRLSYSESFRTLARVQLRDWDNVGFHITWTDDRLGRDHEIVVTRWFVEQQNRPTLAREVEETLPAGSLPKDAGRWFRGLASRGPASYLLPANPHQHNYYKYHLVPTFQNARLDLRTWTRGRLGGEVREVTKILELPRLFSDEKERGKERWR